MALVEIARFQDVYEADLAAAFLASHGVEVTVTERLQTTIDPLMQRARGSRLMAPAAMATASLRKPASGQPRVVVVMVIATLPSGAAVIA